MSKGYTSLSYEDFVEQVMKLPASDFMSLSRDDIRKVMNMLNVHVAISHRAGQKRGSILVAGNRASVASALDVLQDLAMYHHSEITHPGLVHRELDVSMHESWQHVMCAEGRHVAQHFDVSVHIPQEDSMNQFVVLVGVPVMLEQAHKHVQKMLTQHPEILRTRALQQRWGTLQQIEDQAHGRVQRTRRVGARRIVGRAQQRMQRSFDLFRESRHRRACSLPDARARAQGGCSAKASPRREARRLHGR